MPRTPWHRPPAVARGDAGRVPPRPARPAGVGGADDRRGCRAVHDRPAHRGDRPAPHLGRAGRRARRRRRAPRSSPTSGCCAANRSTQSRVGALAGARHALSSSPPGSRRTRWRPTATTASTLRRRRADHASSSSTRAGRAGRLDDESSSSPSPARRAVDRVVERPGRGDRVEGDATTPWARSAAGVGRAVAGSPTRWRGWPGPAPAAEPTAAGGAPPSAVRWLWMLATLLDLIDDWPLPLDQLGDRAGVALVLVGRRRAATRLALQLAVEDRDKGLAWAINARDAGLTRPVDPRTTSSVTAAGRWSTAGRCRLPRRCRRTRRQRRRRAPPDRCGWLRRGRRSPADALADQAGRQGDLPSSQVAGRSPSAADVVVGGVHSNGRRVAGRHDRVNRRGSSAGSSPD